jgi:hypothetical protein
VSDDVAELLRGHLAKVVRCCRGDAHVLASGFVALWVILSRVSPSSNAPPV